MTEHESERSAETPNSDKRRDDAFERPYRGQRRGKGSWGRWTAEGGGAVMDPKHVRLRLFPSGCSLAPPRIDQFAARLAALSREV